MYQINPFSRNVLITPAEVLKACELKEAEEKNIRAAIVIAEERFVKKMLCKALYEDLRAKKNVMVTQTNLYQLQEKLNATNTSEDKTLKIGMVVNAIELVTDTWYVKLWNEYLWQICAEAVMYVSTPTRWVQSTPKGEMLNAPPSVTLEKDAASAALGDVRWKMDKLLQDRIDPLLEAMREWLCDNKANFAKFDCYQCPEQDQDGVSFKRKTGWVHNIYDQRDNPTSDDDITSDNYNPKITD